MTSEKKEVGKERLQPPCKPGSVLPRQSVRSACHLSRTDVTIRFTTRVATRITSFYPPARTDSPDNAGLRELSTPGVYSTHVTVRLVSSYLTFSPLPRSILRGRAGAVVFFYTD